MDLPILIESTPHGYRARTGEPLSVTEEGASRDEALAKLRERVAERLGDGIELIPLAVNVPKSTSDAVAALPDPPKEADEALFLIPTNLTRPFFAVLLQECELEIEQQFGDNLRSILRYVQRDEDEFKTDVVMRLLKREFRLSPRRIRVLVVAPTGEAALSREIAEAISESKPDLPIIALTLPFHGAKVFDEFDMRRPPFIVCNSKQGTKDLGLDAAERLRKQSGTINVVCVHGARGRLDSRSRVDGFLAGLQESKIKFEVIGKLYCDWKRDRARDCFRDFIQANKRAIQVVFAASDEMALGVREAVLHDIPEKDKSRVKRCLIYGFDAIPEMSKLVKIGDRHMKGTVEQPLKELAKQLVKLISKALTNPASLKPSVPGKTPARYVKPAVHKGQDRVPTTSERSPPPKFDGPECWKSTEEASVLGNPPALKRYLRDFDLADLPEDEHGKYGVHGKRTIRKFRVVGEDIYWYVCRPEEKDSAD